MIDTAVHVDSSGFTRWLQQAGSTFETLAQRAFADGVAVALRHAQTTTSFKDQSGDLRKTLTSGRKSEWHRFIKASAKYALFVEEDTKAHEIRPKRTGTVSSRRSSSKRMAPLLRFRIAGHWISKPLVKHPGTKGTHFMRDAGLAGEDALQASLHRAAATAFR